MLFYTFGLPRAGKSTFTKRWMMEKPGRVVVNGDDFRLAVYGQRWYKGGESAVYGNFYTAIRALQKQADLEILIDETNTSLASLKRIWEIDPDAEPIVFWESVEVCKERAVATNQLDLIPHIDHCYDNILELIYLTDEELKEMTTEEIIEVIKETLKKIFADWGKTA